MVYAGLSSSLTMAVFVKKGQPLVAPPPSKVVRGEIGLPGGDFPQWSPWLRILFPLPSHFSKEDGNTIEEQTECRLKN